MGSLVELGYKNTNILNYTQWIVGTSGSQGSFAANGGTTANTIIYDADPWGNLVPIWNAKDTDIANDADGGWNHSSFPIDHTKMYRFSTWFRTVAMYVDDAPSFYHGCHGYGTVNGVYYLGSATPITNPYFQAGNPFSFSDLYEWVLYVSYVWPSIAVNYVSTFEETGIYNIHGKKSSYGNNFCWDPTTTSGNQRTYMFYSEDLRNEFQWVYPRVEIVDGTEPTIQELLGGYDAYTFDKRDELNHGNIDKPISIYSDEVEVNLLSEIGPTGFLYYLPMEEDESDGKITVVGTTSCTGKVGKGYRFNGTSDDYIAISGEFLNYNYLTISAWFKTSNTSNTNCIISNGRDVGGVAGFTLIVQTNGGVEFLINNAATARVAQLLSINQTYLDGNWHNVVVSYSPTYTSMYVDNVFQDEETFDPAENLMSSSTTVCIGAMGSMAPNWLNYNGDLDEIRIYPRVLSAEERQLLYDSVISSKLSISSDTVYTKQVIIGY